MNVGDQVKFLFGGKQKEGTVAKIFPKKVYLKVDFPHHPGKILIRPVTSLGGETTSLKKGEKSPKVNSAKGKTRRPEKKKSKEKEE